MKTSKRKDDLIKKKKRNDFIEIELSFQYVCNSRGLKMAVS